MLAHVSLALAGLMAAASCPSSVQLPNQELIQIVQDGVTTPIGRVTTVCDRIVSQETAEMLEWLYVALDSHRLWLEYTMSNPDADPNDGVSRDERLLYEAKWIGRYNRIILLLAESCLMCSEPVVPASERAISIDGPRLGVPSAWISDGR